MRRLMQREERRIVEIEDCIELLDANDLLAIKIDRPDGAARDHARPVVTAAVKVDLVGEIDGLFRAGPDAGVARAASGRPEAGGTAQAGKADDVTDAASPPEATNAANSAAAAAAAARPRQRDTATRASIADRSDGRASTVARNSLAARSR